MPSLSVRLTAAERQELESRVRSHGCGLGGPRAIGREPLAHEVAPDENGAGGWPANGVRGEVPHEGCLIAHSAWADRSV